MIGVTKCGLHQTSARLINSNAGTVSLANVGEAGPPWHGIEDEPAWGHCDFQCSGCWQMGHSLIGGPFRPHLKQLAGEVDLG